jgi:hypothetical protein
MSVPPANRGAKLRRLGKINLNLMLPLYNPVIPIDYFVRTRPQPLTDDRMANAV